jgi:hypothetical protein
MNQAMCQDCLSLLQKCLVGVQHTDASPQGMQLVWCEAVHKLWE